MAFATGTGSETHDDMSSFTDSRLTKCMQAVFESCEGGGVYIQEGQMDVRGSLLVTTCTSLGSGGGLLMKNKGAACKTGPFIQDLLYTRLFH